MLFKVISTPVHFRNMSLTFSLWQDLFFKYSWNNFLHFQVEICVSAILNHPTSEERPSSGLQNLDGNPAISSPVVQGEMVEQNRDLQTSIHKALVAHVSDKQDVSATGLMLFCICVQPHVPVLFLFSFSRSVCWCRRSWMPGKKMIKYSKNILTLKG